MAHDHGLGPPARPTADRRPEPGRPVTALGIDETSFLKANAEHPTKLVTGFVSRDHHVMIDLVQGNTAADVRA